MSRLEQTKNRETKIRKWLLDPMVLQDCLLIYNSQISRCGPPPFICQFPCSSQKLLGTKIVKIRTRLLDSVSKKHPVLFIIQN